jgi:hypothetical protein
VVSDITTGLDWEMLTVYTQRGLDDLPFGCVWRVGPCPHPGVRNRREMPDLNALLTLPEYIEEYIFSPLLPPVCACVGTCVCVSACVSACVRVCACVAA